MVDGKFYCMCCSVKLFGADFLKKNLINPTPNSGFKEEVLTWIGKLWKRFAGPWRLFANLPPLWQPVSGASLVPWGMFAKCSQVLLSASSDGL